MQFTLGHIATIQTGVFAQPVAEGDIIYLQGRHFDEYGNIRSIIHADLKSDNIHIKHILRPGDVLFAAKGTKNFAAVFEKHNPPSVASTSFFVIRLTNKEVLPDYVAWFINNPLTQNFLKGTAIGTSMVSISKAVLEKLEIPVPTLEIQDTVLKIVKLKNKQKELKRQIEDFEEKQIQQQIMNAINK